MTDKNYFGNKLKFLRNLKGITQQELADELSIGRATVAGYETKGKQPDYDKLKSIALYFNVTIDYLLSDDDSNFIRNVLTNSAFVERFRFERELMRMDYDQLSESLNISPAIIFNWEEGKAEPSTKQLVAIADFFGVTTDYLTGRTNTRHYNLNDHECNKELHRGVYKVLKHHRVINEGDAISTELVEWFLQLAEKALEMTRLDDAFKLKSSPINKDESVN